MSAPCWPAPRCGCNPARILRREAQRRVGPGGRGGLRRTSRRGGAPKPTGSRRLMADGLLPGMVRYRSPATRKRQPHVQRPQLQYWAAPSCRAPVIIAVFWNSDVNAARSQANIEPVLRRRDPEHVLARGSRSTTRSASRRAPTRPSCRAPPPPASPSCRSQCARGGDNCTAHRRAAPDRADAPDQPRRAAGARRRLHRQRADHLHGRLPPNVSLTGPTGAGNSCVAGLLRVPQHRHLRAAPRPLVYGALMDDFTGPCANGCGGNATRAGELHQHRLPRAGRGGHRHRHRPRHAGQLRRPRRLGRQHNKCGEIGDICARRQPGRHHHRQRPDLGRAADLEQQAEQVHQHGHRPGRLLGDHAHRLPQVLAAATTASPATGPPRSARPPAPTCSSAAASSAPRPPTPAARGTCQQSTTPAQDDICVGLRAADHLPGRRQLRHRLRRLRRHGQLRHLHRAPDLRRRRHQLQRLRLHPKTTCPAGDNCGTVSDGCGGTINCGTCTAPQTCGGGGTSPTSAAAPARRPAPPATTAARVPDGCGGTLNCGTCTAPADLRRRRHAQRVRLHARRRPARPAHNCGTVADGCGGTINCGTCTAPQTCGGGGTANVCGCTPTTTCPAGDNCGTVVRRLRRHDQLRHLHRAPDLRRRRHRQRCAAARRRRPARAGPQLRHGAGRLRRHRSTAAPAPRPQTCGGGGTPNAVRLHAQDHAARPATTAAPLPDGCGGTINCGTCTAPQTCGGGGQPQRVRLHAGRPPARRQTTAAPPPTAAAAPSTAAPAPAPRPAAAAASPNVCGCTAADDLPGRRQLRHRARRLRRRLSCGTCPPQTCCGGRAATPTSAAAPPRPRARPATTAARCRTAAAASSTAALHGRR